MFQWHACKLAKLLHSQVHDHYKEDLHFYTLSVHVVEMTLSTAAPIRYILRVPDSILLLRYLTNSCTTANPQLTRVCTEVNKYTSPCYCLRTFVDCQFLTGQVPCRVKFSTPHSQPRIKCPGCTQRAMDAWFQPYIRPNIRRQQRLSVAFLMI